MFTQNQTCIMQTTCTDCPLRVDCERRQSFYSEDTYKKYRKNLSKKITTEAKMKAEKLGLSENDISVGVNFIIHAVDAHRETELHENPA